MTPQVVVDFKRGGASSDGLIENARSTLSSRPTWRHVLLGKKGLRGEQRRGALSSGDDPSTPE